jgi:spore coat polysaccharide biosynthesis predicted glycosyltransferase SpsG
LNVLFRVDSGAKIGLGHLARSLHIANVLRNKYPQVNIVFLCNHYDESIDKITESGYLYQLSNKKSEEEFLDSSVTEFSTDILFIDKLYNYSEQIINKLKKYTKIVMFHNLCDTAHLCNAVILPAAHIHSNILNDPRWMNNPVKFFSGKEYIVFNEKILDLPRIPPKDKIENIIITTGGSDPEGVMLNILKWINQMDLPNISFCALIGEMFTHINEIEILKKELKSNIKIVQYNPKYLTEGDLAISTFGVSTYELIYLGYKVLSIGHCKKNALGSNILSKRCNSLVDLGLIDELVVDQFRESLLQEIHNYKLDDTDDCFVDGKGVYRVADIIYDIGAC